MKGEIIDVFLKILEIEGFGFGKILFIFG